MLNKLPNDILNIIYKNIFNEVLLELENDYEYCLSWDRKSLYTTL
jgi:hypothetical protein